MPGELLRNSPLKHAGVVRRTRADLGVLNEVQCAGTYLAVKICALNEVQHATAYVRPTCPKIKTT